MVRLVVLNYNGGDHVLDCVASLAALDWPEARRELVVVDNASDDGSVARLDASGLVTRLIRNRENTGFSANNLAMVDLDDVDFVALVNPDATVEAGWLRAAVAAMIDENVGAVASLMLLSSRLLVVDVQAAGLVGERLLGAEVDGADAFPATQRLWHLLPETVERPDENAVLGASLPIAVEGSTQPTSVRLLVGTDAARAAWVEMDLGGPLQDVVNNAGIEIRANGYGADRGLGDTDLTSYAEPTEVFGWSGGGALLRSTYLRDVGLFDPMFFLYYEDFDLSWRGRARGWRYLLAPDAVIRHRHASSTVVGSPLFTFHTESNRLVTVLTNAPAGFAARALARFVLATLGYVRADVIWPLWKRRRPAWSMVRLRCRVIVRLVRLAPELHGRRRRLRRRRTAPPEEVLSWIVEG